MPFGAILAGGLLSGAGSIFSGLMGSNAAKDAAKTQASAETAATNAELGMFNTAQSDIAPWLSGGQNALAALQKALGIGPGGTGATNPLLTMLGIGADGKPTGSGINPATFQASPGYQFQLQQGLNGVTNSAAAAGGLGGNALKALQGYGSGLANQSWSQYLGNVNTGWQGLIGNLSGLSGQGAGAAGTMGNQALATGGQIGSNVTGAGAAAAAGTMGSTNALAGGITGATGGLSNAAMLYALMSQGQTGALPTAAQFNTAAQTSPFMASGGLMNYQQPGG
jgi:hypothetical protein